MSRWIRDDIDTKDIEQKLHKIMQTFATSAEQADAKGDIAEYIKISEAIHHHSKMFVPDVITEAERKRLCERYPLLEIK